jgi:integrase/recombinase XerD
MVSFGGNHVGLDWNEASARFLATLESEHTRRAYAKALEAFGAHPRTLQELTPGDLAEIRARLLARGLAPASVSLNLAAWRSFLAWSRVMGMHNLDPDAIKAALRAPRGQVTRPYQVLSDPEVSRMVRCWDDLRNKSIIAVLLGAGLRVAELVALKVADVLEDQDGEVVLHITRGKGNRTRSVPVRNDVGALLKLYIEESGRSLGDAGPLFLARGCTVSRTSRPLTTRTIGYLVRRSAWAAGIRAKRISPHSLRHTYAIRALRYGGNVIAVAKLLGHSDVSTTQRYLDHLSLSDLRDSVPFLYRVVG